jgi:hypothetical protein
VLKQVQHDSSFFEIPKNTYVLVHWFTGSLVSSSSVLAGVTIVKTPTNTTLPHKARKLEARSRKQICCFYSDTYPTIG